MNSNANEQFVTINKEELRQIIREELHQIVSEELRNMIQSESSELEMRVANLLNTLKIPLYNRGFMYLRDAILLTLNNDSTNLNNSTNLYEMIAKRYQVTYFSVERDIRYAITHCSSEDIERLFGLTNNQKLTTKKFIMLLANSIRMNNF